MLKIDYVSDVLCVWAWAAEARNDALLANFGGQIELSPKFINLFGDTQTRIGKGWSDKGGFYGFAKHTEEVAAKFPELTLNPAVWHSIRPTSSMPAHLHLKAAELAGSSQDEVLCLAKSLRQAFFEQGRDISNVEVIADVLASHGINLEALQPYLMDGSAYAALWSDQLLREAQQIKGSPTYIIDGGRQTLFGNVGYRVIEANVKELLKPQTGEGASWC
jgi:predicted DsbA family dithiol-disulfide isomerase